MGLLNLDFIFKNNAKIRNIEKARELLERATITIKSIEENRFSDNKIIFATVSSGSETNDVELEIKPEPEGAHLGIHRTCTCSYFQKHGEICQHMIATMLEIQGYDFNFLNNDNIHNPDISKYNIDNVLNDFRNQYLNGKISREYNVQCSINIADNLFSININMKHINAQDLSIKNLENLINRFRNGEDEFGALINLSSTFRQVIYSLVNSPHIEIKENSFKLTTTNDIISFIQAIPRVELIEWLRTGKSLELPIFKKLEMKIPLKAIKVNDSNIKLRLADFENLDIARVENVIFFQDYRRIFYYRLTNINSYKILDLIQNELTFTYDEFYKFTVYAGEILFEDFSLDCEFEEEENSLFAMKTIPIYIDSEPVKGRHNQFIVTCDYFQLLFNSEPNYDINYYHLIMLYKYLLQFGFYLKDGKLCIRMLEKMFKFKYEALPLFKDNNFRCIVSEAFLREKFYIAETLDIFFEGLDDVSKIKIRINEIDYEEKIITFYLLAIKNQFLHLNNAYAKISKEIINELRLFRYLFLNVNENRDSTIKKIHPFFLANIMSIFKTLRIHFNGELQKELEKYDHLEIEDFKPQEYSALKLFDYQITGVNTILSRFKNWSGMLLSDEMGLGKTIQAITVANYFIKEKQIVLVVSPAALISNWMREIPLVIPDARIKCYEKDQTLDKNEFDFYIISYNSLPSAIDMLNELGFSLAIFDESQRLKNRFGLISRKAYKLEISHKLMLSGTPFDNGYQDFWNIMNLLNPGIIGEFSGFKRFFINDRQRNSEELILAILQTLTQPIILRRLKNQVLKSLPEKNTETIYLDMHSQQEKLYHRYMKQCRKEIQTKYTTLNVSNLFKFVQQARQIALDPRVVDEEEQPGPKLELAVKSCSEVIDNGEKIIIFSDFVKPLELLRTDLFKVGIEALFVSGNIKHEEREEIIEKFSTDDKYKVLLLTNGVGAEGLNLTVANNIILLDTWWNDAKQKQAADRVHRIGQNKKVFVKKLITNNSIEEKMMKLQKNKKKFVDTLLDADSSTSIKQFDKNLILDILMGQDES